MDLNLSEEQRLIVDSAVEFLAAHSPNERIRAVTRTPGQWDEQTWQGLSELGWCGIHLPESVGGLGLGWVALCLLQEQLGRRLACVPYFDTVVLAATALCPLQTQAGVGDLLSRLAQGQLRLALALPDPDAPMTGRVQARSDGWHLQGQWAAVGSAPVADQLLLPALDSEGVCRLWVVASTHPGLRIQPVPAVDATRLHGTVFADDVTLPAEACLAQGPSLQALLAHTRSLAAIGLAAEQVGVAQQALDLSLAYVLQRQQFEKPVASFQAIKHRCAQMLVAVEMARSAVYGAAGMADTLPDPMTLLRAAAQARHEATQAALYCTREAIQLHGGVGFTWEYDPHLYLRRAQASSQRLGALTWWREQVVQQWLDAPEPSP